MVITFDNSETAVNAYQMLKSSKHEHDGKRLLGKEEKI